MRCGSINTILILIILAIIVSICYIAYINPGKWFFRSIYSADKVSSTIQKRQWVRVLDILVLGPFALWLGYKLQQDGWKVVPWLLYTYAYGTIVYNFLNYVLNTQLDK
jgi:uncharacterized protein YqhQ